jgi:NAD(P)-dependent dehydrogenase (short-subunit alcohol dehydrogenase family)
VWLGGEAAFHIPKEATGSMKKVQELMDLSGRTAVVVGGAGLLGYQMATALAEAGANLVIASRDVKKCEEKADELCKQFQEAMAAEVDAGDYSSVERMTAAVLNKFGKIDILVCSMAVGVPGTPENLSVEQWERSIHYNLSAVWYLSNSWKVL